jgi:hypothetical protein
MAIDKDILDKLFASYQKSEGIIGENRLPQQLTLALPFPVALYLDPGMPERQGDCLAELIDCSGKLASSEFGFGVFEISVFDSPELHTVVCSHWKHPGNIRDYQLLVISVDGSIFLKSQIGENARSGEPIVRANAEVFAVEMAILALETDVRNLLLLANVFYPGGISAIQGFALWGDTIISRTEALYTEDFSKAVKAASTANWPPFQKVGIIDGWTWFTKSGCVDNGMGIGRLGRAWAALTYISKSSYKQEDSLDLVWILLGL